MKYAIFLIIADFCLFNPEILLAQDIIYCKDGRVMKTNILDANTDTILYSYYTDIQKHPYIIPKSEVIGLLYHSGLSKMYSDNSNSNLKDILFEKLMPTEGEKQILSKHQFPILETRKVNLGTENNIQRIQRYLEFENQNYLMTEMQNGSIIRSRLTQDGLNIAINGIQIDPEYGNEYIEVKVSDLLFDKVIEIMQRPDTNVASVQFSLIRHNVTKPGEIFELKSGVFSAYEYFKKVNGEWRIIYDDKEMKKGKLGNSKRNSVIADTGMKSDGNYKLDSIVKTPLKQNRFGKLIYTDGKVYEGELVNGIKHGKGVFIMPDSTIYDGTWRNDSMIGIATIINIKGKFVGEIKENGIKHGEGKMVFNDSSAFVGSFKDDEFYSGTLVDKRQKEIWYIYTGKFVNNQIYHGTIATRTINCPKCAVIVAEIHYGNKEKDKAYDLKEYEKHLILKKTSKPTNPIKNRHVYFGMAISGGFNFASLANADPDILDSFGLGYSPSLFMNIKLSNNSSLELSTYFMSKKFKFANYGDNFEFNINPQLTYNTSNAKMEFQEIGISLKYLYRFIYIEGFLNKVLSAKRTGDIYYSDDATGTQVSSDNYNYNFFDSSIFPAESGQRPINEYIYGLSVGLEGKSNHFLLGIGYSLNLKNYFNKNYPVWDSEFNIDFYPTKDIDLKVGYLFLKIGYVF